MATMRYILGSIFAVTSSITILILGMALLYICIYIKNNLCRHAINSRRNVELKLMNILLNYTVCPLSVYSYVKHIYITELILFKNHIKNLLYIFYVIVLYYVFTGKGEQISIAWYV